MLHATLNRVRNCRVYTNQSRRTATLEECLATWLGRRSWSRRAMAWILSRWPLEVLVPTGTDLCSPIRNQCQKSWKIIIASFKLWTLVMKWCQQTWVAMEPAVNKPWENWHQMQAKTIFQFRTPATSIIIKDSMPMPNCPSKIRSCWRNSDTWKGWKSLKSNRILTMKTWTKSTLFHSSKLKKTGNFLRSIRRWSVKKLSNDLMKRGELLSKR